PPGAPVPSGPNSVPTPRPPPPPASRARHSRPVLAGEETTTRGIASAPQESTVTAPDTRRHPRLVLLRKEVIQPHLPVRLPCYDFVPIADPTFDSSLPIRG